MTTVFEFNDQPIGGAMRVVSWNCRRASATHPLWQYLEELSPDIALLQEVSDVPESLRHSYDVSASRPITRSGNPQRFQTALLVRGLIGSPVALESSIEWVNEELQRFRHNLLAHEVTVPGFGTLNVIDVYSPAWPVSRERLRGRDVAGVRLELNRDVWVPDLLVAAMRERQPLDADGWVVGGDFNSCESFDAWKGGPRGNREWLDRMADLGLTEVLRSHTGQLTPTFRGPGKAAAKAQIDHMFVSGSLAEGLVDCRVGDVERVFGCNLSDHLPIIAKFRNGPLRSSAPG